MLRSRFLPPIFVSIALLAPACGGGEEKDTESASAPAPASSEFPSGEGRGLEQMLLEEGGAPPEEGPFIAPAGAVNRVGDSRFTFVLLDVERDFVVDVPKVALYVADGPKGKVSGPFPAARESLRTQARFRSKTTANDEASPPFIYRATVKFPKGADTFVAALIKRGDGFTTVQPEATKIQAFKGLPQVGERAPRIHTPTLEDVGNVKEIDTRDPPTTQHAADLHDVLGKKPVVLLFATPLLCSSRVCGPVADITEQLKQTTFRGKDVEFIHVEIFNDNDPNKGYRKEVRAYGLPSEPWVFVIDRKGIVRSAFEGGFGVEELTRAVQRVTSPT